MDLTKKRLIAAATLIVYSAILIKLVVFKTSKLLLHTKHLRLRFASHGTGQPNFLPFKTIGPYLHGRPGWLIASVNLAGNIAPFVPIGFLAPLVFRNMTWKKSLALALAVGLTMESLEVVFRIGVFDIDDILLNAFGVMIGYWVFTIFNR